MKKKDRLCIVIGLVLLGLAFFLWFNFPPRGVYIDESGKVYVMPGGV